MAERGAPDLVVLGGTSKAATTTVFKVLAELPGACVATEKECRFFLPPEAPLPSRHRYPEDREAYLSLFEGRASASFLLDATPDYLHYEGCEDRIQSYFPDARVVFVLRDPVDRLVSWFKFARQRGHVEGGGDLAAFLAAQQDARRHPWEPTHVLARSHGFYAPRLRAFRERFGPERVGVFFFEDLRADADAFFAALASFLGLEWTGSLGPVPRSNPTRGVRSASIAGAYRRFQGWARYRLPASRRVHGILRPAKRALDRAYWLLNRADAPDADDPVAVARLVDDYRSSVEELTELLGAAPPWPRWLPGDAPDPESRGTG